MQINSMYWFNCSMDHLVRGANELGEVIPRIKVFLNRDGDINQSDAQGNTLLSKAQAAGLFRVVNYLESKAAKFVTEEKTCTICLETINAQSICEEESERILTCNHVFHRECIGKWLIQRHNCPLCRTRIVVATPEAPRPEMNIEEILAVPDNWRADRALVVVPAAVRSRMPAAETVAVPNNLRSDIDDALLLMRSHIHEIRRERRLNLNEDTPVSRNANSVNTVASSIFNSQATLYTLVSRFFNSQ